MYFDVYCIAILNLISKIKKLSSFGLYISLNFLEYIKLISCDSC